MSQTVDASQGKAGFSRSRLFRWGIAFWIVAWIGSVCCYQQYEASIKGWGTLGLGSGSGAIVGAVNRDSAALTRLDCVYRGSIFSDEMMEQIIKGPGWLGILTYADWRLHDSRITFAIPTSGLLCVWMAIGLACEVKFWRLSKIEVGREFPYRRPSLNRLVGLPVLVVALASATIFLAMRSRAASAKAGCQLQIRNIQQAVRSWSGMNGLGTRQPINWSKLIGKGNFINPDAIDCPSGGAYELSTLTPDVGQLAAKCPHPEHQNFAHDDW